MRNGEDKDEGIKLENKEKIYKEQWGRNKILKIMFEGRWMKEEQSSKKNYVSCSCCKTTKNIERKEERK